MDSESHRIYKILEEISENDSITQRRLSQKLGIALGLTNLYIKRLIKKGYIMVKAMPRNRIVYNLTPKGITEKGKLTLEYMKYSFNYYREFRERIRKAFQEVSKNGVKRLVFYGAGEVGELAYLTLQENGMDLAGVVDDFKEGKDFFGKKVAGIESLRSLEFDRVLITALSSKEEIYQRLVNAGIPKEKIILF
jgi:DNA-binding MarR family transcriptional regulator